MTLAGPLASPSVAVDPSEILVRGALALGAGALLAPAAAILPFIELGMSEDSDCLKWITEAEQQADCRFPGRAPQMVATSGLIAHGLRAFRE